MSRARKETAQRFPAGTKVRLSTGGPVMVVEGATGAGRVVCRWFDGARLEEAKFAPETLVPDRSAPETVSPPKPAPPSPPPPVPEANGEGQPAPTPTAGTRRVRRKGLGSA